MGALAKLLVSPVVLANDDVAVRITVLAGIDQTPTLQVPLILSQLDRCVALGLRSHPRLAVRSSVAAVTARVAIAVRVLVAERRWRIDGVWVGDRLW